MAAWGLDRSLIGTVTIKNHRHQILNRSSEQTVHRNKPFIKLKTKNRSSEQTCPPTPCGIAWQHEDSMAPT